ncbi:MAG: penicillin acylase family protein, partial [Myxococcales bacterium]|nr:penicillin acylase family protein [Myxococcales bacterium]
MRSGRLFLACGLLALGNACGGELAVTGGNGSGGEAAGGNGGAGGGTEGGIQIAGLTAPVAAAYDENGILHLSCGTDEDCFASLGYFHAANRFFFMDFVRNLVRGKLGSLVAGGDVVLAQDYANRRWFSTTEGEPLERKLYEDAS